jgi:hypothetical protein
VVPYRDYLPSGPHTPQDFFWHLTVEDERGRFADPERSASVFVWTERDEDHWTAWWVRGREHRNLCGTKAEVIAWARQQDAGHRWLHEPDGPIYLPLPPIDGLNSAAGGLVYAAPVDGDYWYASWQRGEEHRGIEDRRGKVLAWARAQPARWRLMLDESQGGYVPLPEQD